MKTLTFTGFLLLCTHIALGKSAGFYEQGSHFIGGYDPVAYLQESKAVKGIENFFHVYQGTRILFKSNSHKQAFLKEPEKYIPAYNGWCAYAMAKKGQLVSVNPKSFKVIDGKTYLFYKKLWIDTLKKWNKAGPERDQIALANKNWNNNYAQ